jgi:hypothetical protein
MPDLSTFLFVRESPKGTLITPPGPSAVHRWSGGRPSASWGEGGDPVEPAENFQAWVVHGLTSGGVDSEEIVRRDVERLGEVYEHLCVEAEFIALVVGNEGLDDSDPFHELHLGIALLFSHASEPSADCLILFTL